MERAPDSTTSSPAASAVTTGDTPVRIHWPDGVSTQVAAGSDWLQAAREAGFTIPTGCLGGSCGACEIEVNERMVRACVARVPASRSGCLRVSLAIDPYW